MIIFQTKKYIYAYLKVSYRFLRSNLFIKMFLHLVYKKLKLNLVYHTISVKNRYIYMYFQDKNQQL